MECCQPEPAVCGQRENAEQREDEREGLGEVGATEGESHPRGELDALGGEMGEQRGESEEQEGLKQRVGTDFAEGEFALAGDDEQRDAKIAERMFVEQEIDVRGGRLERGAQANDGVGEGDDGEHLDQKDDEVDPVVGAEFGGESGAKEEVADGEESRVHGVPVSVDDAGPLVSAKIIADVHVGDGVAVDLVGVVERIAEGDEGGEGAVDGEEAAEEDGNRGGLGGCHDGLSWFDSGQDRAPAMLFLSSQNKVVKWCLTARWSWPILVQ